VSGIDWAVLVGTVLAIFGAGLWLGRGAKTSEGYLRSGDLPWWTIGISVMATQASAITFLSLPGQAHDEGMGFVQFYYGQPIAMLILAVFVVPIYYRSKVHTAYEYLEGRFDLRVRRATALIFLVQRGLAAGLSIYAPAIVISTVLGWPLPATSVAIGVLSIVYTVTGGTRAVSRTQTLQMAVMMGGMAFAFAIVVCALPTDISFVRALDVASVLGRTQLVQLTPRLGERYTLWSGIFGGLFVGLAYFGTDQSQVQRYLAGSVRASRLGLIFNAMVKVPMQIFILGVGLMVFVFAQLSGEAGRVPAAQLEVLARGPHAKEARALEERANATREVEQVALQKYIAASTDENRAHLASAGAQADAVRRDWKSLVQRAHAGANDADYVFVRFVLAHFPTGFIGLFLCVIFCAAMSATASTLNALATTTIVDFYKRSVRPDASDAHVLRAAQWATAGWGVLALSFAAFASLADNLIQAVNILGSIFYGPTLGVFLIGFFIRRIGPRAVLPALLVGQAVVIAVFALTSIGYLWYNVIGCFVVIAVAAFVQE
jgi:Na+/proline symporter